jgi:hypothetical protein
MGLTRSTSIAAGGYCQGCDQWTGHRPLTDGFCAGCRDDAKLADALALLRRMREGKGYPMWNAEIDRVLGQGR